LPNAQHAAKDWKTFVQQTRTDMCGIFGMCGDQAGGPESVGVLRAMGQALVHRGPDEGGIHTAPGVGLGMRRLSIIDLKTGHQPIANEDGSVWVVLNGEIYNYRELTADLLTRGHRFATASDTETLVHLYEEHGADCVRHLRGMFAFALWDARRHTLLLARDRLGIKPLYYAQTPRGFDFGSELKALITSPWVRRRVDPSALAAYLRFGYVPDPLSILEGVAKLPPGHALVVKDGRAGDAQRYWEPTSHFRGADEALDEIEAGARLWGLLEDAVRSHLVSDVPVGAFLSGGIDSSLVVGLMAREAGVPVKTFSVGFREAGYNEAPYARRVAEWFGTEHHELIATPQDLGLLEEVLTACDEPFADSSAIPTYLVSRLARQHVKVVLSGDGGDELFAGYDRYVVDRRERRLGILGDLGLGAPIRLVSDTLPEGTRGKNFLRHLSLPRMQRYLDAISLFPALALRDLVEPGTAAASPPLFEDALRDSHGLDALSRLQDLDLRTYLPGDILTKVDRMSMAHSLEARVPLLDHPLVEFACSLPAGLRMRGGQTKYLLRRILRGRVPDEVLTRPKQGFAVPLRFWFGERLPRFFRDRLGNGSRLEEIGIRPQAVRVLMDLFEQRGREDHCGRLWALTVLDSAARRLLAGGRA
jgi:asparagine synthase (glutamine-hydrolysing)